MTDTDRLAAALRTLLVKDAVAFASKDESGNVVVLRDPENIARLIVAVDPTLVCPDPEAHTLADAVRRLPGDTDIAVLRLDTDYGSEWHVRFRKYHGHGDTIEAAITAALEDKP